MTSLQTPSTAFSRLSVLRDLAGGLRDEARAFSWRNPRARLALRPVLSVAIAVAAAHAIGLADTWWAAISAFIVMQEDFGASVYRGVLRIVGTLIGAGLGFLLGPPIVGHPVVFVALMALAAWFGLFGALVFRHSYAWVLGSVTFVMLMCEAITVHGGLSDFAAERVANIVLGALACVVVSGLTDPRFIAFVTGRGKRQADAQAAAEQAAAAAPIDRRGAGWHAFNGALAVALLSILVSLQDLKAFPQAMVTTIAVLVVPFTGSAAERQGSVMQRMVQRFVGCLLAGAAAFALLPLIGQQPVWCQVALAVGVWLGAYLQRGPVSVRYTAIQFSVAFLMVFVQDRGWTVNAGPALLRLGGVFAGIAALSLVLFGSLLLRRRAE